LFACIIFENEMSCSAVYDANKHVIVLQDGHTFARGLTKTLAACFSPSLSVDLALKGTSKVKQKKSGTQIGMQLDLALSHWVQDPTFSMDCPRFEAARRAILEQGWTPTQAQVAVGCSTLRLGTMVDIVCRDRNGDTVLVELKCGFDDYYEVANPGQMNYPFQDMALTFKNRHYVQILVTAWLYSHSFANERINRAVILHIYSDKDNGIHSAMYSLPPWLVVDHYRLKECLMVLKRTRHETKRARMAQIFRGVHKARRT
jgi:hypothetical protein